MKEIIPLRLKSARKQAGLSLKKLAEELDGLVSTKAIQGYESGSLQPSTTTLLAISEVLKVKLDYFSRPIRFELGDIEFRKKASLRKKEIETIKEVTLDMLERYVEVEELSGKRVPFRNPLGNSVIKSQSDIEEAAERLRKEWKLTQPTIPNILAVLEENEVKVLEIEGPEKFDGLSTYVEQMPITLLNQSFPVERKRFTALHELGHLILKLPEGDNAENRCHQFAGAMLISRGELTRILGPQRTSLPKLQELIAIKERYGISIQAVVRRAYDLDIINKSVYHEFCRQMSRNKTESGLGQYQGEEKTKRFQEMVFHLLEDKKIPLTKAAYLMGMTITGFRKAYFDSQEEDLEDWSNEPQISNFAEAFSENEPEYDFSDVIEINPDYDPR